MADSMRGAGLAAFLRIRFSRCPLAGMGVPCRDSDEFSSYFEVDPEVDPVDLPFASHNTVDHSGELRVEASLGSSHCLRSLSANRIGAVPMHLEVRAVHAADSAKFCTSKLSKDSGSETRCTPSSETRINRAPGAEMMRKVAPRNTRAKHIPHRRNHASVISVRSPSFVTRGHLPVSGAVRSIFLAAPRAARATPSDL